MRKRIAAVVAALVLAVVGVAALVAYVNQARDDAVAEEELVEVLLVTREILAGESADSIAGRVELSEIPQKFKAVGALTELSDVTGLVASVALLPGEQVVAGRFTAPERFRNVSLEVPEDKLEVTVAVSPERALGGELVPGQTVAVVASFDPFDLPDVPEGTTDANGDPVILPDKTPNVSHLIIHKVLVTNVQREDEIRTVDGVDDTSEKLAPREEILVTLALDAPEVERVVFSAEHGFLWFALEPESASESGTRVQTRGTIYGDDEGLTDIGLFLSGGSFPEVVEAAPQIDDDQPADEIEGGESAPAVNTNTGS